MQCFTVWIWLDFNIKLHRVASSVHWLLTQGWPMKTLKIKPLRIPRQSIQLDSLAGLLSYVVYSVSLTNLSRIQCCLWLQNLLMMHQMKFVVVTHHFEAVKAFISCSKSITFWKIASQNVIQYKVKMSKLALSHKPTCARRQLLATSCLSAWLSPFISWINLIGRLRHSNFGWLLIGEYWHWHKNSAGLKERIDSIAGTNRLLNRQKSRKKDVNFTYLLTETHKSVQE